MFFKGVRSALIGALTGSRLLCPLRPVCGAQGNSEVRARPEIVGLSSNWRF
jgi:hypothetical protein